MKLKSKGHISLEIEGKIYDYKLYETFHLLNSLSGSRVAVTSKNADAAFRCHGLEGDNWNLIFC